MRDSPIFSDNIENLNKHLHGSVFWWGICSRVHLEWGVALCSTVHTEWGVAICSTVHTEGVWHGSAYFLFCNHFTFDLLSGHLYQCYQREGHRVQIEAGEG